MRETRDNSSARNGCDESLVFPALDSDMSIDLVYTVRLVTYAREQLRLLQNMKLAHRFLDP